MRNRVAPIVQVDPRPVNLLTGRQAQILFLRSKGLDRKEVAERLGISEQTVMTHVKVAIKKVKAKNIVHAVAISIRSGWI